MGKLRATAPTRGELEQIINDYFYSKDWSITDDLRVYNVSMNCYHTGYVVKLKRDRWRLEEADKEDFGNALCGYGT